MFFTLLLVTFALAIVTSFIIAKFFNKPIGKILNRIIAEDISTAWQKYIKFAIYVVGISGGVRVWELEKYLQPQDKSASQIVLTNERWILEIYRTIIETLQSTAWMLLVFFLFAMIAYVIVRAFELKQNKSAS
ncbi:MAG: hypothetical protein FD122_147 [Stygiobacter sp.]|nr:MAG: hypothetical protein FD122_147 [Stygiobacter sp.]KAF0217644.1 MAG: hypothetical protein FD178_456 [Ignavibacteria bacterium]